MRRRDRQSEVVVAVIAFGVIALALTFGIILSLGNTDDPAPEITQTRVVRVIENNISATSTFTANNNVPDADFTVLAEDNPSATPTLTPSLSATPTATDSPTTTETAQPSASITPSETPILPSETPSPTDETRIAVSDSPTATFSPSETTTATLTATSTTTHTQTATPTATHTPTFTPSATDTNTATATNTASATNTATFTHTPSATHTPTITPSNTATNTPTVTPSPTLTSTMTITPFPTLTITPFLLPATQTACEPIKGWTAYIVQSGDTLFEIARASGYMTQALVEANCLDSSQIYAGQSLQIPPDSPLLTNTNPAPSNYCSSNLIQLSYPQQNTVLNTAFVVRGVADDEFFGFYRIVVAPNPETRFTVTESYQRMAVLGTLGTVNLPAFPVGTYALRVEVYNQWGSLTGFCETQVYFEN